MPSFLDERAAARDMSAEAIIARLDAIADARATLTIAKRRSEMARAIEAAARRRLRGLLAMADRRRD